MSSTCSLISDKARCFSQSECALYGNFIITINKEIVFRVRLILFRHHCYRDPMRLQHTCAYQCLSLRAVSKKQKFLLNEICTFSFFCRLNVSQIINLQRENTGPRTMSNFDHRVTDSSPDYDRYSHRNGGHFAELTELAQTTPPSFEGSNRSIQ